MLYVLIAAVTAAAVQGPSAAELGAYRGQIKTACEVTLKVPGTDVPKGFCSCFATTSAPSAIGLKPEERAVFLLLTENAGDPVGAQRMAKDRLNMPVETFAAIWDKLNPIGQKAGSECSKPKR